MRLYTILGGLVLGGLPAMASAHHADFRIGFGLPVPSVSFGIGHGFHGYYGYRGPIIRGYFGPGCYYAPYYYAPPVVYAPPSVVYTTPAPVYSTPAPVYAVPQQTYVAPQPQVQPQYYPAPAPQTYYYGR